MVTCYPSYDMTPPLPSPAQNGTAGSTVHGKDYSRPLHVDCSVEYELPDAAKPPVGTRSEPLLMIHPCYYRRAEAQRRTRFVNNLPKTSLSSPVVSSTSGRRSKVPRLTPAEPPPSSSSSSSSSWSQPKPLSAYPAPSSRRIAATADYTTASWPGRTAGQYAPAAPTSAKLDAGSVADLLTCTDVLNNNNYVKSHPPQQQPPQQPTSTSNPQTHQSQAQIPSGANTTVQPQQRLYERQLNGSLASATAAAVVSSYQQLPGYHPHLQQPLSATAAVDTLLTGCKACQPTNDLSSSCRMYQPQHPQHPGQASQATQAALGNRLYGVKAVEPNPEHAANPIPAKVRRWGLKRSRSSRNQDVSTATATAASTPSACTGWSDAMLHLNAATGFSFESPATGVWGAYSHQGSAATATQHAVAAAAPPGPGATADPLAPPLGAWGAMFPHCREREEESRVLWNSDSLLRLVPV